MDVSALRVFLTVAEERGFSRAAVRLFRTQSAVSQAVRRLEDELKAEPLRPHDARRAAHGGGARRSSTTPSASSP